MPHSDMRTLWILAYGKAALSFCATVHSYRAEPDRFPSADGGSTCGQGSTVPMLQSACSTTLIGTWLAVETAQTCQGPAAWCATLATLATAVDQLRSRIGLLRLHRLLFAHWQLHGDEQPSLQTAGEMALLVCPNGEVKPVRQARSFEIQDCDSSTQVNRSWTPSSK